MPKGPKGEKRPADVIGAAVKVMQIATGEIEETTTDDGKNKAAVELGRKGGKARAEKLSKKRRSEIAKKAAAQTMDRVDLWHAPLSKQQDIRSRFFQRRSCKTVRQGLALTRSCDKCHQDYTCLPRQIYAG